MNEDLTIIQAIRAGNIDRYAVLVYRYQNLLLKTAYQYLHEWEEARDAVQEAFIRAYENLPQYREAYAFSAWLYRILVNICLDRLKSARHRYRSCFPEHQIAVTDPDPHEKTESRDLIRKSMEALNKKQKQAFVLMDLQCLSSREAGEIMACSESTARVHLMKARRRIRKTYLEHRLAGAGPAFDQQKNHGKRSDP